MTRIALGLAYDGSAWQGWQTQPGGRTVQDQLESALASFLAQPTSTICAGRTDAGVHALAQVAHFDLQREYPPHTVRDAINFHLKPNPVAILEAEPVSPDFDARRSAVSRAYLYRIENRRARAVLDRGRVWHVPIPLDAEAMNAAAQLFVGRHDFSAFRAAECQAASPVRTIDSIAVTRSGSEIRLNVRARSFLHNQVRIPTGTLKLVGEGRWSERQVAVALASRDRSHGGPTAPPFGLYLTGVVY